MRRLIVAVLSLSIVVIILANEAWAQKAPPIKDVQQEQAGSPLQLWLFIELTAKMLGYDVDAERDADARRGQDTRNFVYFEYNSALKSLNEGNRKEFYSSRYALGTVARDNDIDSVRKLARDLLNRLPKKFVPGFAYVRDDGKVAADPDPRVQLPLIWDRHSVDGGDSDAH